MNVHGYVKTVKCSIRDMWHVKRSGKGALSADEFVDWYYNHYGIPHSMIRAIVEREEG